jgi:hypothetical protein
MSFPIGALLAMDLYCKTVRECSEEDETEIEDIEDYDIVEDD